MQGSYHLQAVFALLRSGTAASGGESTGGLLLGDSNFSFFSGEPSVKKIKSLELGSVV